MLISFLQLSYTYSAIVERGVRHGGGGGGGGGGGLFVVRNEVESFKLVSLHSLASKEFEKRT